YAGFREESCTHHPLGKFGLAAVQPEIHFAGLFPRWRSDGRRRAQNNCILDKYHPVCPNASLRLRQWVLVLRFWRFTVSSNCWEPLDGIDSVVELGSQGVWCPDRRLLTGLFEAFSRPVPPSQELEVYINASGTGHAASRHLHEKLGFKF